MRIKVDVEQLSLGMYVAELDRPWLESPFLFQGFIIEDDDELAQLRETCNYVFVDDMKSRQSADLKRLVALSEKSPDGNRAKVTIDYKVQSTRESFTQHFAEAAQTHSRSNSTAIKILDDFRLGKSVDTEDAKSVVSDLVSMISTNSNTALWLTNLREKNQQLANHCLNVSILSIAFARHLGYPIDLLESVGVGALLHDLGLTRLDKAIIEKPGNLTQEEFEVVKKHPGSAEHILKLTGQLSPEALQIVRLHHERVDGSGYPDGLKGEQIPEHVLIVAIADVYDSMTCTRISSDRTFRNGLMPQEALTNMHKRADKEFGGKLMEEFIKCIGIYPIGSLVLLNSGALGIVMSSNPEARLKPLVLLVRDAEGNNVYPRSLVNLATMKEGASKNWSISRMVDPSSYGIDVSSIAAEEMFAQ